MPQFGIWSPEDFAYMDDVIRSWYAASVWQELSLYTALEEKGWHPAIHNDEVASALMGALSAYWLKPISTGV